MIDTMTRYLAGIHPPRFAWFLRKIFLPLIQGLSSARLTSAGLVITAGGGTTAKIGAADFYAVANGVIVKVAAATAMPAITGVNFGAGHFNVACFYVKQRRRRGLGGGRHAGRDARGCRVPAAAEDQTARSSGSC